MATNEGTRCKPSTRRKKKPIKKAKPRAKVRSDHPPECDYHRYRGTVNQDRRSYQQFDRLAKMLGEVEAALDTYYRIARKHGLLCAPDDGSAAICQEHVRLVHRDVDHLTALLSPEAKMLLPILFMVASGHVTVEGAPEGETIH